MPVSFGDVINNLSDKITGSFLANILKNPIYMGLVIAFIIMIIIMFIFKDVESDTSVSMLAFRSGFYIFVLLVVSLFLNNKVLMREGIMANKQSELTQVFGSADRNATPIAIGGGLEDAIVPVNVNMNY